MKTVRELPPIAFLRECFVYDPETGNLIWQKRPREHFKDQTCFTRYNRHTVGKTAGLTLWRDKEQTRPNATVIPLTYAGVKTTWYAHRIIFALQGVEIPTGMYVDHINGDPTQNQWLNLRLATPSQNCCNKKKNSTGKGADLPKGVSRYKGVYRAILMKDGKSKIVGIFSTPEKAHFAYCEAARELHGEFFRCG